MKFENTDIYRAVVYNAEGEPLVVFGPHHDKAQARVQDPTNYYEKPGNVLSRQRLTAVAEIDIDRETEAITNIDAKLVWTEFDRKEYT